MKLHIPGDTRLIVDRGTSGGYERFNYATSEEHSVLERTSFFFKFFIKEKN
jgi:hypothetical protein